MNLVDGVTSVDALCVLRDVANLPQANACPETPTTLLAADVNQDGAVNSTDALCVLRIVAHLGATQACPIFGGSASIAEPNPLPLPEREGETWPAPTQSSVLAQPASGHRECPNGRADDRRGASGASRLTPPRVLDD